MPGRSRAAKADTAEDGTSAPRGTLNEARWDEILAAAADVFIEKGYEPATVREIAGKAGLLNQGSLYLLPQPRTARSDPAPRGAMRGLPPLDPRTGIAAGDFDPGLNTDASVKNVIWLLNNTHRWFGPDALLPRREVIDWNQAFIRRGLGRADPPG